MGKESVKRYCGLDDGIWLFGVQVVRREDQNSLSYCVCWVLCICYLI